MTAREKGKRTEFKVEVLSDDWWDWEELDGHGSGRKFQIVSLPFNHLVENINKIIIINNSYGKYSFD